MPSLNTKLASAPNTTSNYVLKATSSTTIGNSLIFDNGTNVGVGTASPQGKLHISGGYTGFQYNSAGTFPAYNTYFGAIGTNFSNSGSELDIWNTVGGGFAFRRQTAASTQNVLMYISSGGNVGIGIDSPGFRLHVLASGAAMGMFATSSASGGFVGFRYNTSTTFGYIGNGNQLVTGGGVADMALTCESGNILFANNSGTERMRITSGGFTKISNSGTYATTNNVHEIRSSTSNDYALLIGNTSASPYGVYINYPNASPNSSSTNEFLICGDSNNTKLIVWPNGTVVNRTGTYGTISSDLRLKENITEATSKLDDLMALRVVNFNLTDDTDKKKQIGFIAQEFKEVFPSLVYEKDTREYDEDGNVTKGLEDALGLNVGMEFAILVKAIQELNQKVEAQQQQINQLINK